MVKLLNEGKTDLLPGFVSQRTRRPFKAFLAKGKDGKVSFEFEERKAKAPAKGKAAQGDVEGDEAASANVVKIGSAKKPAAKPLVANMPAKELLKKAAPKKAAAKKATTKKTATKKVAARKPAAKKLSA